MKRNILILLSLASLALVSCGKNKQSEEQVSVSQSEQEVFEAKPVDGIAPLFDEGLGYFNTNPSIINVSDSERYVFYTVNDTYKQENYNIAVRKATKNADGWTYGDKKIILRPSENGWDKNRVLACDVIQGSFRYQNEDYNYLMAYEGNNTKSEAHFNIGLAVAKTLDGDWIKVGTEPIIKYDPNEYGMNGWGCGQPSLVSYDKQSKLYLFYTLGEPMISQTRVCEIDAANLDNIQMNSFHSFLNTTGLVDYDENVAFVDADFAIDETTQELISVRNVNPISATPPMTYKAVQVAKMPLAGIYDNSSAWTIIEEKVNMLDLDDPINDKDGWERVLSGCIVSDPYSRADVNNIEIGITVTSWNEQTNAYLFYQTITTYKL